MTERFQKSPHSMGFLNFSTSAAFDNIDLPLLNPNFTGSLITGLNASFLISFTLSFLPLALFPSFCDFRFLFWYYVHLFSSPCKNSQI